MTQRPRVRALLPGAAGWAAIAFLAGHLFLAGPNVTWHRLVDGIPGWFLTTNLDDIDGINFAMGVADFDVSKHQPHPPGYPLFVLLGKLTRRLALIGGQVNIDFYAVPLALWGVLAGALAAFPLLRLFRLLTGDPRTAIGAMLLTLACPIFWFTAGRALSDMPGFAAALGVQAILATAFVRQQGWHERSVSTDELVATGRLIVLGAFLAGFIMGLRSQTVWLTVPLLLLVITDRAGRGAAGALLGGTLTFAFGVLAWLVPLVFVSGGLIRYWHALTSQAGEDIEGVDMLITSAQPIRRLALNLYETFALPWASLPLAIAVLAFASVGAFVMVRRSRRELMLLAGLAGPYAAFHLLFQENLTTRYALPIVPAVAFLAAAGARAVLWRAAPVAMIAAVIASLWVAVPALHAAAVGGAPIFSALAAINLVAQARYSRARSSEIPKPRDTVVAMHRRVYTESRRAREWVGTERFPWRLLPAPRGHEWLELVKYWREGGLAKVFFIADPRRTDLALIDPSSRSLDGAYRWPFQYSQALVGGARPDIVDGWSIQELPGWFLGEGWALTPETAGVANQDGKGPAWGQAVGWIRRRPEGARLMIGGRNLGAASDPEAQFTLKIEGRVIDTWHVKPNPGFFLRGWDLPAGTLATAAPTAGETGAGDLRYARVTVSAEAAGGASQPVKAAVEQFDLQPLERVMFGFDTGWHEDEHNPRTGLRWRWSSDRAVLRVWPAGKDVRVRLRAESPLRTFDEAPVVTVRACDRELARLQPAEAFTIDVPVSAAALDACGGRLELTTTKVFVPAEHVGSQDPRRHDRRRLGLRVFETNLTAIAAADR